MKKVFRGEKLLRGLLALLLVSGLFACVVNLGMVCRSSKQILSPEAAAYLDWDCVLVLGCGVREDGTPSSMLADRLDTGIALWRSGAGRKLLLSGDHGTAVYNEVSTMEAYALGAGVEEEAVFLDHAGFSTYDSIYRARYVFGVEKCVIVTQRYHLYRALKIARSVGIEAVGVSADLRSYASAAFNNTREFVARTKDFLKCVFLPPSTYVGDPIPITGSGLVTRDSASKEEE